MTDTEIPPITKDIYIILPSYNEEKTLKNVVLELIKRNFKVLIIDDGSKDKTPIIGRELSKEYPEYVSYYRHVINLGLGGAIKTGIKAAIQKNADIMITFDADGQHAPDDLYNMYPVLEKGAADIVIGARDFNDMPTSRKFGNTLMNYITYIFQGLLVKDSQSGLRAFTKDTAKKLDLKSPQYGVSSEIIGEIKRRNLKLKEVPMTTIYNKYTIEKGTNTIIGIKIIFEFINEMLK